MASNSKSERAQAVRDLVEKAQKKLLAKVELDKVTLADYIRLLQLEKELEADEPAETRVRWIEPKRPEVSGK